MATLKSEEDYSRENLFVIEQAEKKIITAQRNNRPRNIYSYSADNMYFSTLAKEDWDMLHSDNDKYDEHLVQLFFKRSIFE